MTGWHNILVGAVIAAFVSTLSCTTPAALGPTGSRWVLASVVITDDGRTTYIQALDTLEHSERIGHERALEIAGNAVLLVNRRDILVGLAESPEWRRYSVSEDGSIGLAGRLSFASLGLTRIDYGNALVSEDLAISVSTESLSAIVWNPISMEIIGEIDLPHLQRDGYDVEVWTTVASDGRVFIPARWANWEDGAIHPGVSTTIVDPRARTVVAIAEDDRCASGGRVVFDSRGYGYVMGDGRNYSIQMFANARGETAPSHCLLRIPPGGTDFEQIWYYQIPELTGGLESATELEFAEQGSGIGFTKLFYPDQLPVGVEPIDFDFWAHPAFRTWRIELGDVPRAKPVEGVPYSSLGFEGSSVDGHLFAGEGPDHSHSIVFEIDPATNTATRRFEVVGLFYHLAALD